MLESYVYTSILSYQMESLLLYTKLTMKNMT